MGCDVPCVCCAAELKLDALANENHHNGMNKCQGSSSSLPGSRERILKFEMQMYKMRDGEYCIDIQVSHLSLKMGLSFDVLG